MSSDQEPRAEERGGVGDDPPSLRPASNQEDHAADPGSAASLPEDPSPPRINNPAPRVRRATEVTAATPGPLLTAASRARHGPPAITTSTWTCRDRSGWPAE